MVSGHLSLFVSELGPSVYLTGAKVLLFQRINYLGSLLCISGLLIGCGGNDGIVPARGVVTYKGAPIAKIAVVFMPTSGAGQIAEGTTDANGNFELQTQKPGDGAKVGNYNVAFKFVSDVIPDMPGFEGGKKPEPSPIPEKYGDASQSGFTATVEPDAAKNVFKFDLK